MYKLRPYQERALTDLMDWLHRHPDGNPIVDACVGAGKSVIIAELCKHIINLDPQARIVMCVASRELCWQNYQKLMAVWQDAPAGLCSASLGKKDLESQIIFSTIGSIAKHAHELGKVNVLIVDECHNINTDNMGMYRTFIDDIKKYGSPYVCVIGFTGTPFRGDGVWLWQGKDPLFAGTATRITMDELLEAGYLAPLVVDSNTPQLIDVTGVKVTAGDYNVNELNAIVSDDAVIKKTVENICSRAFIRERKKGLIFCATIEHAQKTLAALKQEIAKGGVAERLRPALLTSETPMGERVAILDNFKRPDIVYDSDTVNCLVNVACLTTGFDAPMVDYIILLRPTKSPVLYVQIAGRGMRIAEGKTDCLWLDYTNTTRTMGAVNRIKGRNKTVRATDAKAPFRYCPECGNSNPVNLLECAECGTPMPNAEQETPHNTTADVTPPIVMGEPQRWVFDVEQIGFYKHQGKQGNKPPSLRIDYFVNGEVFPISEWKAFESDSAFAIRMASQWWIDHLPNVKVPLTIDEALHHLHHDFVLLPTRIYVTKAADGKFWRVTGYDYGKQQPNLISFSDNPEFSTETTEDLPF